MKIYDACALQLHDDLNKLKDLILLSGETVHRSVDSFNNWMDQPKAPPTPPFLYAS